MSDKSGRIITFYSYKGGTGRSMALSNVAWILASNGCDVLLVDWDLEAPGLHRYLRPFLVDPELKSSVGMIDFVWDAARVNVTPLDKTNKALPATEVQPTEEFPSLEDYVLGLDWDFGDSGSISLIPAGRQDENYAQRVNTFTWDDFYERLGGGKLLQAQFDSLRKTYDYILIDSRTGVSDTSGICTVQLPDKLAVFFTLNWQGIKGAAAVASSVRAQRDSTFQIFPVPSRLENGEQDKLKDATDFARQMFAPCLRHVGDQLAYWHDVETPYISYYAFEEVPAAFMEEQGSQRGVLAPMERLAARLSDQRVTALKPASEALRKSVIAGYKFTENGQPPKIAFDPTTQADPGGPWVVTTEGKMDGISFELRDPQESIPLEQQRLKTDVEDTLMLLNALFLDRAKDRNQKVRFDDYFAKLFSIAKLGLMGDIASAQLATAALKSLHEEVLQLESGRVKGTHIRRLGLLALTSSLVALGVWSLSAVAVRNGCNAIPIAIDCTSPGALKLASVIKPLAFLWIGSQVGSWLSFCLRKVTLDVYDLPRLRNDRVEPVLRLIFAGALGLILGLIFILNIAAIEIGQLSTRNIQTDGLIALLIGVFCGLSEQTLATVVTGRASVGGNMVEKLKKS